VFLTDCLGPRLSKVDGPEIAVAHRGQKAGGPRPARPNSFCRLCCSHVCMSLCKSVVPNTAQNNSSFSTSRQSLQLKTMPSTAEQIKQSQSDSEDMIQHSFINRNTSDEINTRQQAIKLNVWRCLRGARKYRVRQKKVAPQSFLPFSRQLFGVLSNFFYKFIY